MSGSPFTSWWNARARRVDPSETAPRTALVLSGGGNQGAAQVGMLQALIERGVVPSVVVGTSVGALNGAAVALSPTVTGVEALAQVWRELRSEDVFPGSRFSRAWNILRRSDHLFSNEGIEAVIDKLAPGDARFDDLAVPLRVVATDLDTGDEVVFALGPLKPPLLATTALPGLFPPVEHGGRMLVDGGVVNNVPLRHALTGPVDRIYVLDVSSGLTERTVRFPLDVLLQAFAIARNRRYELERHAVPADVEVITLPRPHDDREIFDFTGTETIMEEAYALAAHHLDEWERKSTETVPRRQRRRTSRRPAVA